MQNKDFFIGWQEKLPISYRKPLRIFVVLSLCLIPVLTFILVTNQNFFRDHIFQLGKIKSFTGILYLDPVPVFYIEDSDWDPQFSPYALLVGFGKHGAEGVLKEISTEMGELHGQRLRLEGTLILGDGKSLIELTRKRKSIVEIIEPSSRVENISPDLVQNLEGEIVDPKCYFGVMKPGEGKVHKSCAIRCISGGIPPVLRTGANGENKYYVILGRNGEKINKQVLSFIAEPVLIRGTVFSARGWNYIKVPERGIQLIENDLSSR